MLNAASLPDDIDALKQLVIEQRTLLVAKDEQLLSREILIEKLRIELMRLKRARFGRSSERLDAQIAQLELTLEELEASTLQHAPAPTPTPEAAIVPAIEPGKPVRKRTLGSSPADATH